MSESGKTSSSLVVAEKRTQRPGGCVGIFFQLLDWNRRLAKKKLFSTKLLPPARAKRATKKFGGDEKLPMAKLLLIADENRGGFPNAPKCENDSVKCHADTERTREMRPPGLVARLMGLDSMPERRDKPKKPGFPEHYHELERKSKKNDCCTTFEHFSSDREDRNLEKGHGKNESRPKKLQKTGIFERHQVTRFGAEALQLKSALSRSKKHHSKLAPPVKSPRVMPGKKSTRLMGAATRILEPGLQATNRAKYALPYSSFLVDSSKDDITAEETSVLFPDQSVHQICYGGSNKSLKGQVSCNSCGNLFDVMEFRSNSEEQMLRSAPSASDSGRALFQGMARINSKPLVFPFEQGRGVAVPKMKDHPMSVSGQTKAGARPRNENCSGRRLEIHESPNHHISSQGQHTKPRKDATSSAVSKLKAPKPNQMSLTKDRVPSQAKMSSLRSRRDLFADSPTDGTKDFVSMNRTSSRVTRTRTSPKIQDKIDMERNGCINKHDLSSRTRVPIRKVMSTNVTDEKADFTQPTFGKRSNDVSGAVSGKGVVGPNACSVNDNRDLRKCSGQVPGSTAGDNKNNDIVSFTFSSPLRHNNESPSNAETIGKARSPENLLSSSSTYIYDLKCENSCSQMETLLSGDALGALLEEKLRELTSRDRDEWESGDDLPGKSTASILQDLISALTVGKLPSHEDKEKCLVGVIQNACPKTPVGMSTPGQVFNANKKLRDMRFSDAGNSDHLSPGSVLEASFSNDSWLSDSFDDSSENKLHPESTECSYSQPQLPSDPDADVLDSATSLNTWMHEDYGRTGNLNNMTEILYGIDLADIGLVGIELKHIKDIITNTELLLGSVPLFDANDSEDFPTVLSLLHKLENLPTCNRFMDTKEGDQFGRFLFDYVIEWLDSKYSHYCKSGFRTWQKLPLRVTEDMLAQEVSKEIGKYTNLAGKLTDEIIEKDMNHNLGKWSDFEKEKFRIGTDLEWNILESLVDEAVIELGQYSATGSSCRSQAYP